MKTIFEKIKNFFTYTQISLLPLIILTLILFIVNKILQVEWYISILAAFVFAIIVPKFINPNWDSKLLKVGFFQKYLNFMLIVESIFLSSFMARFTTGVYLFIILEVMHQSTNLLISFFSFFLFFLFLLYFRLRSQIFSINDLAYDVVNEISPSQLNNHFLKMLGVQLNLNFKHNYYLMGFPKRNMHSTFKAIQAIGRSSAGPLVGAGLSYTAYHSDQAAAQRNQLAEEQITRLARNHEALKARYYQRFSGRTDTPEYQNVRFLMDESAASLERLSSYAQRKNIVGIRIFTKPVPTDRHYQSLQTDTMESLAMLQSRIESISPEIQKTALYEIAGLVSKIVFI